MAKLPDLKDAEAVQKFFLEEIQLGEELLAQGDYEKGVDHLTNAIAVCGQPQSLLQVLQQTLPPPVFQMLLTKLPSISQVAQLLQKIKLLLLHQVSHVAAGIRCFVQARI
ncbi:mitochondrial import receptor subunit TOM20 homolog [Trematomus bernacchii]|uniref:mitochondrial import receptor subunit TOM20 homolog n=1 Tax=Trematomus bernacchii TaxID=40690 RepID=UPI00146B3193|nr:mitochondrial import receptor subunit TOM20 homolog [Trematomus bernacchii]